jgi:nitroreductase
MKGHCGATIERRTDSWGWFGIGADMPLNGGGTMVSDETREAQERSAMEAWDAICARRNVRQYKLDPVSEDHLNRIAEAGWRAPSAKNRQPWDFVIVTDQAQLQELSTVWRGAVHIAAAAAAIVLVVPVPPDDRRVVTDSYDVGQATMAMMIAATDLGLGTGHSSVGDQEKARAILGVPDDHLVAFMLGIGYPADRPLTPIRKPNRRPFSEVVHRGHW